MQNTRAYHSGKGTSWRSATILVAEDDDIYRQVFSRELIAHGYHVLCAENAGAAITIARQTTQPIDILITDYFMPDLNGRELADRMVAVCPNIKVLYMTAYIQRLLPVMSSFESCAGTIFPKPVAPDHLEQVIQALLAGNFKSAQKS